MHEEIELITKPEELKNWMKEHDVTMELSLEDIQLLMDYFESHDYALATDKKGELVRVDFGTIEMKTVEYTMDEVIDVVCDWNYELIVDADEKRNNPKDFQDFVSEQKRYENYIADEVILDRLFEQTKYAVAINVMAENIATEIIKRLPLGLDAAVGPIKQILQENASERVR